MATDKPCFGFYMGNPVCNQCRARNRCKAVLITDGFEMVAATVESLMTYLPEEGQYRDTDRVPQLVDQILEPPMDTHQDEIDAEDELLNLLEKNELDRDDVARLASS